MKPIADLIGQGLEWTQPAALKMQYELRAGNEVVATLRFRSSFGSFATAESSEGCWTFKRVGFLHPRVTIRNCDGDKEIASFKNNTWTGGGTLESPAGKRTFVTTNFWQTKLEFRTESEQTILQFHSGGFIHLSAKVDIDPTLYKTEPAWMVMLGWYLIIMMHMDSAAVTAAIS